VEGNPMIQMEAPLDVNSTVISPNAIEPGLTFIGAPNVWGAGFEGQGIVVAGMDTELPGTSRR